MNYDINELKSQHSILEVVSKYIKLEKKGAHYAGLCVNPQHNEKTPSLMVTPSKEIFKCFGCGISGDIIDFVKIVENVETLEAAQIIAGVHPANISIPKKTADKKEKPKKEWKHVTNPTVEPESFSHYIHGEPTKIWNYKNEDGTPYGYVCRFDLEDGTKQVLPFCLGTDGTTFKWRYLGFQTPRKLYNADKISQAPKDCTVIIVEGEKTADAGTEFFRSKTNIFTTWVGGANGVQHADWSILEGKRVIFIPDHDTEGVDTDGNIKPWYQQAGNKAMLDIHNIVKDFTVSQKWVYVPNDKAHKWDIADENWKPKELKRFIIENVSDVPTLPLPPAPKTETKTEPKPTQEKQLPAKKKKRSFENEHFRFLGYEKDENGTIAYYFFSFSAKSVIKLSPSRMTKSNLMMLAPINYWEVTFPGKNGMSTDAIQQFLIERSHATGIFMDKYIRGRGAWMEDGEVIIHEGEFIVQENKKTPIREFESDYVYEIGENLDFGGYEPLKTSESGQLIDYLDKLKWERPINSYLLAGWCVIAPFCGVLPWRPHIWVTGPAGSGKSWVMENIVKTLMGETAIVVQGKTTEAGIRGRLQADARPILFDESDIDSINDKERIQGIISAARASSYSDGGGILKGTQTGTSRSYASRSCYAFSSIGVHVNNQSDRSRFTMLGLLSHDKTQGKDEFKKFMIDWSNSINKEWVHKLQARTMKLMPIILENTKTFADAAGLEIGNKRLGDQVGSMLAGAYSLKSSKIITIEEAIEWVKTKDWNEEKGLELTKDEWQLWNTIVSHPVRVESTSGIKERNVGELLTLSLNYNFEKDIPTSIAHDSLKRIGIMVSTDGFILVSNTAPGIKSIVRNTSWAHNHNKILERLEGTVKFDARKFFAGHTSRSIGIPISYVVTDEEKVIIEKKPSGDDLMYVDDAEI